MNPPRGRKSKRCKKQQQNKKNIYITGGLLLILPRSRMRNSLFVFYLRASNLKTEQLRFYDCGYIAAVYILKIKAPTPRALANTHSAIWIIVKISRYSVRYTVRTLVRGMWVEARSYYMGAFEITVLRNFITRCLKPTSDKQRVCVIDHNDN